MTGPSGAADAPGLPDDLELGPITLAVSDAAAVTEFYRDVLGFEDLGRDDGARRLGVDGRALVRLVDAPGSEDRPPGTAGLFHVAYRVPTREALGPVLERLRSASALSGASDHGVSEALYGRDPEGNGIEVYADRPRSDWPREDDGSVRIYTRPLDLQAIARVAPADGADRLPAGTTLGHVHLEVTDLERARRFYTDVIGFEEVTAVSGAAFLAVGGYHHHLGVNVWNGPSAPAGGPGLERFDVTLPGGAAVGALTARLEAAGHDQRLEDDAGDDTSAVTVADPDGITWRFVARGGHDDR